MPCGKFDSSILIGVWYSSIGEDCFGLRVKTLGADWSRQIVKLEHSGSVSLGLDMVSVRLNSSTSISCYLDWFKGQVYASNSLHTLKCQPIVWYSQYNYDSTKQNWWGIWLNISDVKKPVSIPAKKNLSITIHHVNQLWNKGSISF